ncbi:uncharacterized protein LOC113799306 isoform X2 [Dermatophagoides pteronyssinus]|uniref:uncharacterized protein LOC113799306 isoform X2 n=1 Tax=Dermatophagoides pteronyssinus TaxID=6956 RepID=UPI003F66D1F3
MIRKSKSTKIDNNSRTMLMKQQQNPSTTSIYHDYYSSSSSSLSSLSLSTSKNETFLANLKIMSTLLHGFLLSIFGATYLFTIWFSWNKNRSIIWDYLYLTHWNLTFQVFFLIIELLSDFSSTFDEMTIIFRSKFLHSILIPFSLCVSIVFWVICIFYNENVLRGPPAERWPEWHNHISHTIILPAIVIECIINDHRLPIGYHSLMITIVMGATYILWVTFFGVVFGKYSYELIETASATKTIFFFLLLMIFLIIANHIGRWLHIIYWRKRRTLMQKNK